MSTLFCRPAGLRSKRALLPMALALALASPAGHGAVDLPTAPLQSAAAIPSNILFMLDDSGSMQFEMMPDEITWAYSDGYVLRNVIYLFPPPTAQYGADNYYYGLPSFDDNNYYNYFWRSSANNSIFYDPTITYVPWVKYDGSSYGNASPSAAYYNPANTVAGTLNLTARSTASFNFTYTGAQWITGSKGSLYLCSTNNCSQTYWPITFYMYKGTGDKSLASSYFKYQIQGTTGYKTDLNGGTPTAVTSFTWGSVTRTVAEETQNFANWFSYYRSRVNAAKAGSSIAFSKLGTNYRVGFSTINTDTLGNAIPTSGTFDGTNRQNWFSALLGATIPPQGTPLKESLKRAGEYFSRSDDTGPYGPAPQLSCRRNFTILTTDGYYNPPDPALNFADEDSTAGSTITGPGGRATNTRPPGPTSTTTGTPWPISRCTTGSGTCARISPTISARPAAIRRSGRT